MVNSFSDIHGSVILGSMLPLGSTVSLGAVWDINSSYQKMILFLVGHSSNQQVMSENVVFSSVTNKSRNYI